MNALERSLAEAVRDSIHSTTPGGYRKPEHYGLWLACWGGFVFLLLLGLTVLAVMGRPS